MRCSSLKINPSGKIPSSIGALPLIQEEIDILEKCNTIAAKFDAFVEEGNFVDAITETTGLISDLNRYWSIIQPWKFTNNEAEENKEKMKTVFYMSFEGIRIVALLLQTVMPDKMKALLDQMSIPLDERAFINAKLDGCSVLDRQMEPSKPLFAKI